MRRRSFLFIVLMATLFSACKKDQLHWHNVQKLNSNTTSRLNHVSFIGNNICIACGGVLFSQSEIVRSADGGYTWTSNSYSDAPKEMFGLGVSANGTVYISGIDGDVLHSRDSGNTWHFDRIGNWAQSLGGTFASPDTGLFISGIQQRQSTITRVDSGFNIIDQQTFLFGLNSIYMTSPTTGYVIGYGVVMKTGNGGNTWDFQDVKGDNFEAMDIHGDEVWMCGYTGSIFHTINGGISWQRLRNGNDITLPRYYLMDIVFKDEANGWAVCDNGKVIYTGDGGQHWEEYEQFTTGSLRSVALCPNGDLITVGDNGAIYRITP